MTPPQLVSNMLAPQFSLTSALGAVGAALGWGAAAAPLLAQPGVDWSWWRQAREALAYLAQHLPTRGVTSGQPPRIGIPAYTCAVTATPWLSQGWSVHWLDTDHWGRVQLPTPPTLQTLDALLVIHPWGQRLDLTPWRTAADTHGLTLIEDCAHAHHTDPLVADARLYSWGREKDLSCVAGGALATRHTLGLPTPQLPPPSQRWQVLHALQPLWYSLSLPWWHWGGALLPKCIQALGLLPLAVSPTERTNTEPYTTRATLGLTQRRILQQALHRQPYVRQHRLQLSAAWAAALTPLVGSDNLRQTDHHHRVLLRVADAPTFVTTAKRHGFHLVDWQGSPIAPAGTDLTQLGYVHGQCQGAEHAAQTLVTLPTNPRTRLSDVTRFATLCRDGTLPLAST